jgi:hypothetical protein
MFFSLTTDKALSLLDNATLIFEETVIPKNSPSASHSPYLPEYEWLFVFERKLARFLDPWLKKRRSELIGSSGLLSEALSNAYCHGHKRDPSRPISVNVYKGTRGIMLQISDTGDGFNANSIMSKFLENKNYYYNAGNGTKSMYASEVFGIFYSNNGKTFHLIYFFNEDIKTFSMTS